MQKWMNDVLLGEHKQKNGIVFSNFKKYKGTIFHEKMPKGAILRDLAKVHLHLAYWETPYYIQALDKLLLNHQPIANDVVVDIGCGDGRFTEYLLKKGHKKIIATDSHLKPLESLVAFIKKNGYEKNVLIIHCSADELPIKSNSVTLALAIGVFYYLNDKFEVCLQEANRVLKKGSVLINSEPDLEGAIYKSIFFEDIDDIIDNFQFKKFKEEKGETKFKFRLFSREEIKTLLKQAGFKTTAYHGLSLLPSILRIKMVREEFSADEISARENEIRTIFDYFNQNGSLFKHIIWKSIKQ